MNSINLTNSNKTINLSKKKQLTIKSKSRGINIDNYIKPNKKDKVIPKIWELPNRKNFFNWISSTFNRYEIGSEENEKLKQKQRINKLPHKKILLNIQQLIRDFMQDESPYKGILLYYALGVGKSASSIVITEAITSLNEVLFMSRASLESNFINEIKSWGNDYMTYNNYWTFSTCKTDIEKNLAKTMKIPDNIININGGVFFIDYSKNES